MLRHIALIMAILANVALLLCIASRVSRMNPILPGTSSMFWVNAAGVSIDHDYPSGIRQPMAVWHGRFFYARHLYTADTISEAPAAAVLADFPKVIAELKAAPATGRGAYIRAGFDVWNALPASQQTPEALIAHIDEAQASQLGVSVPTLKNWVWNVRFQAHLAHAKLYWATLSFEFLFLSLCIWWTAWPLLRPFRAWRYALHFGLLPLLFVSPIYFGYATYVAGPYRTGPTVSLDSFGPGVVYPQLAYYIPNLKYSPLDLAIIQYFPKSLETISLPYAGYLGPGTSVAGPWSYDPSLTICVLTGVAIAGSIVLAGRLYTLRKRSQPQGFPVLLGSVKQAYILL